MRKYSRLFLTILHCIIYLLVLQSRPALSANVLEKAVESAQPCRSLKVDTALGSVGVDKFGGSTIRNAEIVVNGDAASAKAIASLRCRTSDNAFVSGDASATFELDVELSLATCEISRLEFRVTETDGTFGDIIKLFKDDIAGALQARIVGELARSCK